MDSGLTVREYEGLVADALRRYLKEDEQGTIGFFRHEGRMIRVEDVVLEASEHERMVVVYFRDETRPRCLFGWRFPSNDEDDTDPEARRSWGPPQAEVWASITLTNFEEQIMAAGLGLPAKCDPDGITWVGV